MDTPTPGTEATHIRVIKKLPPGSKGALKLAQQFGPALVCVRHRVDAQARHRYTTVELLVEKTPIRARPQATVAVRIEGHEKGLQQVVKAAGARWDGRERVWRMPKRLVGILRLSNRLLP